MNKEKILSFGNTVLNVNDYDEELITNFINTRMNDENKLFIFHKTDDGYSFTVYRDLKYGYEGQNIIDQDIAMILGINISRLRPNPNEPNSKPLLFGIPGRDTDGFYFGNDDFGRFYIENFLSNETDDNVEVPKRVGVFADDKSITVFVHY